MPNVPDKGEYGDANPWIIAVLVAIATFMEVLDTTIANVALRYIAGGLAVSADEASWVITTYLVANSIVLCASGWIAEMFGRKNFFLVCIALFTASSLMCGFAWNLQSLLVFRLLQGLAGGGMTPVAQSILAAAFPPAKRGQGFALGRIDLAGADLHDHSEFAGKAERARADVGQGPQLRRGGLSADCNFPRWPRGRS
jgi:DHA2 family multidrug resistance protein